MTKRLHAYFIAILAVIPFCLNAQVTYHPENDNGINFGTYGRVGVDWSFENGGSIGRRLNLNNMGSIGGRLEEQDYVELASAFIFKPFKDNDPTIIKAQSRLAIYSQSLSLFGNSTSSSLGGLTFALPELYVEASNIGGKDLSMWIGAKFHRFQDVHIADHFYFDDHTGQGFGIKYKNTSFSTMFVSSNDTSSTAPPYFYLNIGTGSPSIALRQRAVFILEHELELNKRNSLKLLGEIQRMAGNDLGELPTPLIEDSLDIVLDYPTDYGYVIGAKLSTNFGPANSGNYNRLAVRYGSRLANGGDGGLSKTWNTFGAPDLEAKNFKGAYSISVVDELFVQLSETNDLDVYLIYTKSKGAADSDGKANSYWGREVYNRKQDFTIGLRDVEYISDKFHLMGEFHYSQRRDGVDKTNAATKFSIAPTFVPTGKRNFFARPHFRFVCSVAHYNDAAQENLYSPYLQFVGPKKWGYYLGIKAEWWLP